ncbi:hypothetical protein [Limnothrix sp. FACHB-708]|uniref:hypothetical protein n=1 Tax=Limnothrix sp. FACHB-708 TaxID=2692818 RepID=UPI0016841798|nr:hypothetical protein [Limnothrix sp. FACHB-708]MBD2589569.1 hypothetical protein [Limnothrix sp. FACHB-406]
MTNCGWVSAVRDGAIAPFSYAQLRVLMVTLNAWPHDFAQWLATTGRRQPSVEFS